METVKKQDVLTLKKMFMEIFGDSEYYINMFFEKKVLLDKTFIVRAGNDIAAMAYLCDYAIVSHGREYRAGYVCGVGTKAEYRHQGHMHKILNDIDEYSKGRYDCLFLIPQNQYVADMYASCGYERVLYRQTNVFKKTEKKEAGDIKKASDIYDIYKRFVRKLPVYVKQQITDYEINIDLYKNEGGICLKNEGAFCFGFFDKEDIIVKEIMYDSGKYKNDLLNAVCERYNKTKVIYHTPCDDKTTKNKLFIGMVKPIKDFDYMNGYINMMLD